MKNFTKIFLICAGGAVAVGIMLMAVGFAGGAKKTIIIDKSGFHTVDTGKRQEVNTALDAFDSIDCRVDSMDVSIIQGDGYSINIDSSEYYGKVDYSVQNGKLVITRGWNGGLSQINFGFDLNIKGSSIVITVPSGKQLGNVYADTGYGDLKMRDLTADKFTVISDNGKITVGTLKCGTLKLTDDYGDVNLDGITADTIDAKSGNGKINYSNINAKTAKVKDDYGDITIDTMNADSLILTSGNGDSNLKNITLRQGLSVSNDYGGNYLNSVTANSINILSNNGDMRLLGCTAATCTLKSDYGKITADTFKTSGLTVNSQNGDIILSGSFEGTNKINSDYGKIKLTSTLAEKLYNIGVSQDYGELYINGNHMKGSYTENNSAQNSITVKSNNGDVSLNF